MVKKDIRTWQIDHIIPQSKLPYFTLEDENFKKCWALENLRPLESFENLRKSNNVVAEATEKKPDKPTAVVGS